MSDIRIDRTFRKDTFFETAYDKLKIRMKDFADKHKIQIFEAAELFFKDNFGDCYYCGIDKIMCYNFPDSVYMKIYLDGVTVEDIIRKISYEQNETCFPVAQIRFKKSYIRYIFLTESNKFFFDNGVYLGNNYRDVIDKIFNNKIEIRPVLCEKIFVTLTRHGWSESKKQDISSVVNEYRELGIELFPAAKKFFEIVPQGKYIDWFFTHGESLQTVVVGKPRLFSLKDYLENPEKYFNIAGEKLVEVIQFFGFEGYRIYISESGKFYFESLHQIHYITDNIYLLVQWFLMKYSR